MERYWKCPKCGAVLDKGPGYEGKALMYLSPFSRTVGTVTCGKCQSRFPVQDVYSGKYDVTLESQFEYEGKPGKGDGSSGCFIATAACGLDSEEVIILRHFRDTVLLNSALGCSLVRTYYRVSPPISSLIADSPIAKYVVRNVLVRPWARLANKLIETGLAQQAEACCSPSVRIRRFQDEHF